MHCPKCGATIPEGARYCPSCAASTQAAPAKQGPSVACIVALVIGVLGAVVGVIFLATVILGWSLFLKTPPLPPPQPTPARTGPVTMPSPGEGGEASGLALDDLLGEWTVDFAMLDGPPPETLTFEREGESIIGLLNDRINTFLELTLLDGDLAGSWTDPQVDIIAADAVLTSDGLLEVYTTDDTGMRGLLISARRPGAEARSAGPVTSPGQAEDLVAALPEIRAWIGLVEEAADLGEGSSAHIQLDSEEPDKYIVHVFEMVDDGDAGHTATYGWYEVDKDTGEIRDTTLD